MNITHIAWFLWNTQQSRFTVQNSADIFWRVKIICMLHQVWNNRWIDVTCTCSHHNSTKRSKAHRSIHWAPLINCCDRSTVSDVASDEFQFFNRFTQKFRSFVGYILMASSMCSVFTDLIFSVVLSWQWIAISLFWHSCVERCIKNSHTGNVWKNFLESTDTVSIGRIVQRS